MNIDAKQDICIILSEPWEHCRRGRGKNIRGRGWGTVRCCLPDRARLSHLALTASCRCLNQDCNKTGLIKGSSWMGGDSWDPTHLRSYRSQWLLIGQRYSVTSGSLCLIKQMVPHPYLIKEILIKCCGSLRQEERFRDQKHINSCRRPKFQAPNIHIRCSQPPIIPALEIWMHICTQRQVRWLTKP